MGKKRYFLILTIILLTYLSFPGKKETEPDYSLFEKAIKNGNIIEVERLIASGASINARSAWGGTPLLQAVRFKKVKIARLLIDAGANVNTATYKELFLQKKLREFREDVVLYRLKGLLRILLYDENGDSRKGTDFLPFNNLRNYFEKISLTIIGGCHRYYADHQTPLMFACEIKDRELINHLLQKGANVNTKDSKGNNALFYALQNHMDDIAFIHFVLQTGIDINFNRGEALRIAASWKGSLEVVQLLFEKDIKYRLKSREGRNALMSACMFNPDPVTIEEHLETIRYLLPYYDVNAADKKKQTAAYYTIDYNNIAAFEILVNAGADLSVKDRYNRTLLEKARESFCDGIEKNHLQRIVKDKGISD